MPKYNILAGASIALMTMLLSSTSWAQATGSCAGRSPIGSPDTGGVACTLTLDTVEDLILTSPTVSGGGGFIPLNIAGDVIINHAIDSVNDSQQGSIVTDGGGRTVIQNAAIGANGLIDGIVVNDGDTWIVNANIFTGTPGSVAGGSGIGGDIQLGDLGDSGTSATMHLNGDITILGQIFANNASVIRVGADGQPANVTLVSANNTLNGGRLFVDNGHLHSVVAAGAGRALSSVSIAEGASARFDAGLNIGGSLDLNGSIHLGPASTTTATNYNSNGSEIYIGLTQADSTSTAGEAGRINIAAGIDADFSRDTVFLEFVTEGQDTFGVVGAGDTDPGTAAEGVTFSNVFTGTNASAALPTLVNNSYLYDARFVIEDADTVNLNVTRRDLGEATTSAANFESAKVFFETFASTEDPVIKAIQRSMSNATSQKDFNDFLSSTQPTLDASSYMMARFVDDHARSMVRKRLHDIRNEDKIKRADALYAERSYTRVDGHENLIREDFAQDLPEKAGYVVPNQTRILAAQRFRQHHSYDATGQKIEGASEEGAETGHVIKNKTKDLALQRLRYLRSPGSRNERALSEQYRIASIQETRNAQLYKYEKPVLSVWSETFTGSGSQNDREAIDGYRFRTSGLTLGVDAKTPEKTTLIGGFLTYADTNMDSDGANNTEKYMHSYKLGLYGSRIFENDRFMNLYGSIGLHDNVADRRNVGGTRFTAHSSYDSNLINLSAEYGKYWTAKNGAIITPTLGVQYSRMAYEDYEEIGAQGANLVVTQDTIQRLEISPTIAATWHYTFENGISFIPEANLGYSYNLMQDKAQLTSHLKATEGRPPVGTDPGGEIFTTYNGFSTQDHSFNLGLGANIASENWQLLMNYSFQIKEEFDGHIGSMKLNYNL